MPFGMCSLVIFTLNRTTFHILHPGTKSPARDARPARDAFVAQKSAPRVASVEESAGRDGTCQRPCHGSGRDRSRTANQHSFHSNTFEIYWGLGGLRLLDPGACRARMRSGLNKVGAFSIKKMFRTFNEFLHCNGAKKGPKMHPDVL